jgi:hypothetical protein
VDFKISQTAAQIDTRIDSVLEKLTEESKAINEKLAVYKQDL